MLYLTCPDGTEAIEKFRKRKGTLVADRIGGYIAA